MEGCRLVCKEKTVTTRTLDAPSDRDGVRRQAGRRSAVLAAGLVVALVVPWVGLQSTAAIVPPTLAPQRGLRGPRARRRRAGRMAACSQQRRYRSPSVDNTDGA